MYMSVNIKAKIILLFFLVGVQPFQQTFQQPQQPQHTFQQPQQPHHTFQQPFPLLRPNGNHSGLEIVVSGLNYLSSINSPISIISAVGGYHSGKSFLLNSLNRAWSGQGEFMVAEKVSPQTMGVWLLDTGIILKQDGDSTSSSRLFLMDTEGFYGNDVAEEYDAKIFTVSTLLSSHVLYNSIKLIDQSAVEYLEILARRVHVAQPLQF